MTKNNAVEKTSVQYDFLRDAEESVEIESHEIDYEAAVHLKKENFVVGGSEEEEKNKKYAEEFDGIVFYCRDCKALVEVKRLPPTKRQKVKFQCEECSSNSILYGTKRGIEAYFHLG